MLHWGGKPALPKIMDRPEPAWLLGSRAFVNFFSIYFRLPIDTKYLKRYLYIIINNKTKNKYYEKVRLFSYCGWHRSFCRLNCPCFLLSNYKYNYPKYRGNNVTTKKNKKNFAKSFYFQKKFLSLLYQNNKTKNKRYESLRKKRRKVQSNLL